MRKSAREGAPFSAGLPDRDCYRPSGSSVTQLHVPSVVTATAQRDEVVPCVGAAATDGYDVVDFLHRYGSTVTQTVLAQRVRLGVAVTDAFPRSSVLLMNIGTPLVSVVASAHLFLVLFTILTVSQVGTAGVSAGLHRFLRHTDFTFFHIRRSLKRIMYQHCSAYPTFLYGIFDTSNLRA